MNENTFSDNIRIFSDNLIHCFADNCKTLHAPQPSIYIRPFIRKQLIRILHPTTASENQPKMPKLQI